MLGRASEFAELCRSENFIAIDFDAQRDLSEVAGTKQRLFRKTYAAEMASLGQVLSQKSSDRRADQLWHFVNSINIGDVICSPDGHGGYYLGVVDGGYYFVPSSEMWHRRKVRWIDLTIPAARWSSPLLKALQSPGTLIELERYREEIAAQMGAKPAQPSFWWSGQANENLFLEITDRQVVGTDLTAPLAARGGKTTASYLLVPHVSRGDIVAHYDSKAEAIIGVSAVAGPPEPAPVYWVAKGSYAIKAGAEAKWIEGVRVPLSNFTKVDPPISLREIRSRSTQLLGVRDALIESHPPKTPLYFPWVEYKTGPIRTFQTYLAKLPRAAAEEFPLLLDAVRAARVGSIGGVLNDDENARVERDIDALAGKTRQHGGQGFQLDQQVKVAIENYAMNLAWKFYDSDGWKIEDVHGNRPYDYVVRKGNQEKRVEVKGTTTDGSGVILTPNEVENARTWKDLCLFIVRGIVITRLPNGGVEASGGSLAIFDPWRIDDGKLEPLGYKYQVPPREPSDEVLDSLA